MYSSQGYIQNTMHRGRVLIVDDDPLNLNILHHILRDDYDVFMANNGKQALSFCKKEEKPDLILLDVVMPGVNGLDVCKYLKSNETTADIPVIFITSQNTVEQENLCWIVGCTDFIPKPVNHLTLKHRVRTHLMMKRQAELLKKYAWVDGLTGVCNRRYFDEHFKKEWRRCMRSVAPLSLIMFDIDYFKSYNDTYGHLKGDTCLCRVAETIARRPQRAGDLTARYGGEEFAVILPETSLQGAVFLAQAIGEEVQALNISHSSSAVSKKVTLSAGVATVIPDKSAQPAHLIQDADAQLYRAKRNGRAQVCSVLNERNFVYINSIPFTNHF